MHDFVLVSLFLALILSPCLVAMFRHDEDEC